MENGRVCNRSLRIQDTHVVGVRLGQQYDAANQIKIQRMDARDRRSGRGFLVGAGLKGVLWLLSCHHSRNDYGLLSAGPNGRLRRRCCL